MSGASHAAALKTTVGAAPASAPVSGVPSLPATALCAPDVQFQQARLMVDPAEVIELVRSDALSCPTDLKAWFLQSMR